MSNVDLMCELILAQGDPRDPLAKFGVEDPNVRAHCGLANIQVDGTGKFYQPVSAGMPAVIVPVLDADELVDLLAFDPRKPDFWRLRLGQVPLLGSQALDGLLVGAALRVHRTPLSWLQADLEGIVVLDMDRALFDLAMAQYGLIADDPMHQKELRAALRKVARRMMPHIVVERGAA